MDLSRRHLLVGSSLAALTASCRSGREARVAVAERDGLERALQAALSAAQRAGATYADARVVRREAERVITKEDHVERVSSEESYGLGVRVLIGGAWGFASSATVDEAAAVETANRAVLLGKAHGKLVKKPIELAKAPAARDRWSSPMQIDPFRVPLADKVQLLLAVWPEAQKVAGVRFCEASCTSLGEWKLFASTDGSVLEQSITRVNAEIELTAADPTTGEFVTRNLELPARQAGWEHIVAANLPGVARKLAEDAVEKLRAPSVEPGKRDLILAPSNLWLTIHESVGHPTELDRVLGWEANFAGTSFATLDKKGKLQFAAPHVTLYADKTTPGALATCAYDDEGVRTQRWDLVKDGVLVGYQTTRDQAAVLGEAESRGTCYGATFDGFPFQRMPNVSLAPGKGDTTVADIIAATDDGIYVTGNGSWSIDHQRYNFQVKKGKITRALRDVAYQANTLSFWNACDLLGGAKSWELYGALNDGKGEPSQSNAVGHGCPPARFRNVSILNTNARGRA